MTLLILVLFVTGLVIWDTYFFDYTTIEQKRIAQLVHSLAAVAIIVGVDRARLRGAVGARQRAGDDARHCHAPAGRGGITASGCAKWRRIPRAGGDMATHL